jgi:flagellar basal body-associated protein FliL
MKDGKYLLYLYIPDATSNNVEAYMADGQEEENASYGLLVAFLIIAVVLSCLVASGIWFLAFAQNKKKKEAFYHDFDLDMDDQENKTVVSGSLDEEEMDWDSFIE